MKRQTVASWDVICATTLALVVIATTVAIPAPPRPQPTPKSGYEWLWKYHRCDAYYQHKPICWRMAR